MPHSARLWILLLTALLLAATPPFRPLAEIPLDSRPYSIRSWGVEDGLPETTVLSIAQTPDGYLWLGTPSGLVRFDGVQFFTFTPENSPGFLNRMVHEITMDNAGAIWFGTDAGLTRFHEGVFRTFTTRDGLRNEVVQVVAVDGEGAVWAGGDKGLDRIHQGAITHAPSSSGQTEVREIAVDRSGRLWAIFPGAPPEVFESGRMRPGIAQDVPGEFRGFFQDRDGAYWLGRLYHEELLRIEGNKTNSYKAGVHLPGAALSSEGIVEDAQGGLWLAYATMGLVRHENGQFTLLDRSRGLPSVRIRAIYIDREQNLWMGSVDGGLTRIRPQFFDNFTEREGLPRFMVRDIAPSKAGLWVLNERLYRYSDGRFNVVPVNLPQDGASLFAARDGTLYIGHFGHGISVISPRGELLRYIENKDDGDVFDLIEDTRGTIWAAGLRTLSLLTGDGVRTVLKGRFTSVAERVAGEIWAGTAEEGLARILGDGVTWFKAKEGLASPEIITIAIDEEKRLWVGTERGLSVFVENRFRTAGLAQGLPDSRINQIADDGLGNLWIGCNTGLYRYGKSDLLDVLTGKRKRVQPLVFGKEEGMLSLECPPGPQPLLHGGRLFFTTRKSIVSCDPSNVTKDLPPPPVVIQSVLVDGEPWFTAAAVRVGEALPVTIPPGATRVEFHFAGLSYSAPERVTYQYKLEGYEDQWVNAGRERFASYTRLPPGDYTFRVIAANNNGIWNDRGASIALVVQPRFWQTASARIGAGLLFLSALYLAYIRWVAGLRQRQEAQEAFARELINSQERERKRIAGELHDSLSQELQLIRNRAQTVLMFLKPPPEVAEQVKEISEGSSRAIAETRAISYALRPPELERFGLSRAIQVAVRQVGEATGMRCSAEVQNVDGLLAPEVEINFYRIIQEALNNIVKHAQATEVIVEVQRREAAIHASLYDNGRGFTLPTTGVVDADSSASLGISGMRERARLLGGSLELDTAPGKGVRVSVTVPITKP